jgi:hypothetical protein
MKKRKSKKYQMLKVCFILTILLIGSCDTVKKREKLVSEIQNHFQENREMYKLLQDYFPALGSYYGFAFNYKDDKITLKQGGNPIKIDSISQVMNDTDAYSILKFMEKENIRDISSNKEWITVTFEDFKYPCFSFWFRDDFNPSDDKVKEKIENFKNTKTKNWLYVLDDKWFIKGEACF